MHIYDKSQKIYSLDISDWAAQLSYDRSPTAGWGVPVNAIEFTRTGRADNSSVMIWLTLSGTGVGRGFQAVGHKAGCYRNNMTITRY